MEQKFTNVTQYIAQYPNSTKERLNTIRQALIKVLPEDTLEKIAYQMPTYKWHENVVHFAAYDTFIGFYPTPSAITHFANEISSYKSSKGAVQFPLDQPLPLDLIIAMAQFRIDEIKRKQIANKKIQRKNLH